MSPVLGLAKVCSECNPRSLSAHKQIRATAFFYWEKGIRNQNQAGLSKAYDLYSGATLGIISRIIKNPSIAEEILQQTFLKVWNKIDSYDASKSSFFTWLSTIARNTAIDKKRLKSFENQNKTDSLDASVYVNATTSEDQSSLDVEKITNMLEPKYKIILENKPLHDADNKIMKH